MTDEEILDLADRFSSREQATAVLDAAEVPRRRRPRWRDDAVRFWFEVSELVAGGKVPGGRTGLWAAVARESPVGLFEPVPGRWAPSSPASLLLASREVVDFHWRDEELADLRRWCEGGGGRVRLIVGPGGQGKTRLAMRLCAVMRSVGWDAGLLSAGAEERVFDSAAGSDRSLLLVVDRVEARPTRLRTVFERLIGPRLSAGAVVRVLLLARSLSAGTLWWELMGEGFPDIAVTVVPEPLGSLDPDGDRIGAYLLALGSFVDAWRAVEPDTDWGALAGGLVLPGDLAEPANELTFTVHLRALTDLLQAGPRPVIDGGPRARPEDVLLAHEARYWREAAARHRLPQPESVTRAAVAAAALCGAEDADEAIAVLGGIPELTEADVSVRLAVAEWLRDLYPAQAGAYWSTLVPDRIAEHHLGGVLRERPELAAALLTAASGGQLAHGLITLAQASDHQPHLAAILASLLTDHPTIAPRAVWLVPTALVDLIGSLPDESVELAEAAATVVARATRDTNADTLLDLPLIFPGLLTSLASRLIVLGRRETALSAVEEATRLFRLLDAAPSDARTVVSVSPYDAIRHEPVLGVLEAAGELGSVLAVTPLSAVAAPGALTAALAGAARTMSFLLARLGRPVEALAAAEEAVATYRRAVAVQPGGSSAELGLASALGNLSACLPDLGRLEEAVVAAEEAVAILRRRGEARPDVLSSGLATALISLSNHLAALERHADAVEPAIAALAINRQLAQEHPALHTPAFAVSLTDAAVRLSEAGDQERAISTAQEAVVVLNDLYRTRPAAFTTQLATTLTLTGQLLHETGRTEAMLQALVPALRLAGNGQLTELIPVILTLLHEERRRDEPAFDAAWTTIAGEPVPDGL